MNNINFNPTAINWINNSNAVITWTNSSSATIAWEGWGDSYSIRMADFIRITTTDSGGTTVIYRLASTPSALTIPAVDAQPFDALGALVKVGDVQRDIKSTANETSITLVGIDTAQLGWVLSNKIKGSLIEMWHGFFNNNNELITQGGTGGLYKFFTGYVNSFNITEQWAEEARSYYGVINVTASSIQIILQNGTSGRYTNNNSWQFFDPNDSSMNRVASIQQINYFFGKDKDPSLYRT
jgi:hypothetical protein